jgi:hypothetical protein
MRLAGRVLGAAALESPPGGYFCGQSLAMSGGEYSLFSTTHLGRFSRRGSDHGRDCLDPPLVHKGVDYGWHRELTQAEKKK